MDDSKKKEIIGALIAQARKKQKLTQDKLAELINIETANLSRIETGKSFPSFSNFCKIIEILKIEPNYYFSFIQYEKIPKNQIDLELEANLTTLDTEVKIKLNELISAIKK